MSNKNLARTAIEGGRSGSNKWERNYSHKETRAEERAYLKEVETDTENWYEYDIEPTRPVRKQFSDKLNPVKRWLSAQVGRLWNDVRSDIAEKFDTRTTAGRHIVEDHMLGQVEEVPDLRYRGARNPRTLEFHESHRRDELYVDDDGYLQHKVYVPRKTYEKAPSFDLKRLSNWLNGRIVGKVGDKLYWFVPTNAGPWYMAWQGFGRYNYYGSTPSKPIAFHYLRNEPVYKTDAVGRAVLDAAGAQIFLYHQPKWTKVSNTGFRQYRKLDAKDMTFWEALPEYYRRGILECSPTAPKPPKETKKLDW